MSQSISFSEDLCLDDFHALGGTNAEQDTGPGRLSRLRAIKARESVCPSSTLDETSQCPMLNRLTCETIAAKILLVDIHLEERI